MTIENKKLPLPPFTMKPHCKKYKWQKMLGTPKTLKKFVWLIALIPNGEIEQILSMEAVKAFLKQKWEKELNYKLKKELWGFRENRMAVRFEYEWHDHSGQWFRSYGNELWEFDENGLMQKRFASINDLAIDEKNRKLIV